jgi:hypothetical protein
MTCKTVFIVEPAGKTEHAKTTFYKYIEQNPRQLSSDIVDATFSKNILTGRSSVNMNGNLAILFSARCPEAKKLELKIIDSEKLSEIKALTTFYFYTGKTNSPTKKNITALNAEKLTTEDVKAIASVSSQQPNYRALDKQLIPGIPIQLLAAISTMSTCYLVYNLMAKRRSREKQHKG